MTTPNSKARRRHIHALTRRADHLRQVLIADEPGTSRAGRSYEIAELSALKAAISVLKERYETAAREPE